MITLIFPGKSSQSLSKLRLSAQHLVCTEEIQQRLPGLKCRRVGHLRMLAMHLRRVSPVHSLVHLHVISGLTHEHVTKLCLFLPSCV